MFWKIFYWMKFRSTDLANFFQQIFQFVFAVSWFLLELFDIFFLSCYERGQFRRWRLGIPSRKYYRVLWSCDEPAILFGRWTRVFILQMIAGGDFGPWTIAHTTIVRVFGCLVDSQIASSINETIPGRFPEAKIRSLFDKDSKILTAGQTQLNVTQWVVAVRKFRRVNIWVWRQLPCTHFRCNLEFFSWQCRFSGSH